MSSRTCGVAVAVSAIVGGAPSRSRTSRDAQVARPEVVAPLADAVRLVDGEQRHADLAEALGRSAGVEPLGRDVEQLDLAAHRARHALGHLGRS